MTPPLFRDWLARKLPGGSSVESLALIAGDASPRQYFRLVFRAAAESLPQTRIGVVSPASEKNDEFIAVRALLESVAIRVPKLYALDLEQGFLMLEDLGDTLLLSVLNDNTRDEWYRRGMEVLLKQVAIQPSTTSLPEYSRSLLQQELDLFPAWFLQKLLGYEGTGINTAFAALSSCLLKNAQEQPQVVVHRDFHSRNLMCVDSDQLGVIDFQDAVIGPVTYDAVSLLKDCYIHWPRQVQCEWLARFQQELEKQGTIAPVDPRVFVKWYDLMGIQRHLKVLGIFARLALRDAKPGYLEDLPLVLAYLEDALRRYSQSDAAVGQFQACFEDKILPLCRRQSWYRTVALEATTP